MNRRDFKWRLGRRATFAVGAALVAMAAARMAYATIPDGNGVFTACKLNATGTIRLIDPSSGSSLLLGHCTSLETQLSWDQQGQPGPAGASQTLSVQDVGHRSARSTACNVFATRRRDRAPRRTTRLHSALRRRIDSRGFRGRRGQECERCGMC
jgi:hypothetical protein